MNLPTIIVLALVAAALVLVILYYVRSGRKITDCGCGGGRSCGSCRGCALSDKCQEKS